MYLLIRGVVSQFARLHVLLVMHGVYLERASGAAHGGVRQLACKGPGILALRQATVYLLSVD